MAIPAHDTTMLPCLQYPADGQDWRTRDIIARLADHFELTEDEMEEMLPSKRQKLFYNRAAWGLQFLKRAGLVGSPQRGVMRITPEGQAALRENKQKISNILIEIAEIEEQAYRLLKEVDA